MDVETEKFLFVNVVLDYLTSREINASRSPGARIKTGVNSADVTCKSCSYAWRATAGRQGGLKQVIGAILVECPECTAKESVPPTTLMG